MNRTRILAVVPLIVAVGFALHPAWAQQPGTTRTDLSAPGQPRGPGSVSGAPYLPEGFAATFASRYVSANGLRLHAAIGYAWGLVDEGLRRGIPVLGVTLRMLSLWHCVHCLSPISLALSAYAEPLLSGKL